MKLQTKITLITTPVVIFFMLVIGGISHWQLRAASEHQSIEKVQTVLSRIEREVSTLYETAEKDVELFSASTVFKNYILTPSEEERLNLLQPTIIRLFRTYQKANPNYYEIRILLPDGYEDTRVTVKDLRNVTEEEGNSDLFRAVNQAKSDIFTDVFKNPDNNEESFFISKKILLRDPIRESISKEKSLRGYLAVTVSLDFIQKAVQNDMKDFKSRYFVIDGSGEILFHTDQTMIGQKVSGAMLHSALEKNKKSESTLNIQELGSFFFYSVHARNADLLLCAAVPKKDVFASSRNLVIILGILTLCAIVVFSFLLFSLGRYFVVNPIMKLRGAVIEIGKGHLDCTVDLNTNDEIGELAKSFMEMSRNLKESNARIRQLAYHDFLTGLPNRVMFHDLLNSSLARAHRLKEMVALIFIDLDNFKRVNDTLGHKAGDSVLQQVAARLQHVLRDSDYLASTLKPQDTDLVARLGGDEFTVVLPIKKENDTSVVARRLLNALNEPIKIEGQDVFIGGSLGITIYPIDAQDSEELIKAADIAMYHAKEQGKNNYQYYSASMNKAVLERLSVEAELRRALENNEFVLYYQPQVDTLTGMIVGLEALIRWQHPEKGLMAPSKFIPVAKESNLIVLIGDWVVRSAVNQLKSWKEKGIHNVPVSVNLSSPQFFQHLNVDVMVAEILGDADIDAEYLKIELVESAMLNADVEVLSMLQRVRGSGVHICLDGFGTGYSSLNYLKIFPIDVLKIDRSFVKNIATDQKDAAMTAAIIALAKSLKLLVVAEGVESQEQYAFLQKEGCDVIQGNYFYEPMPVQEIGELLPTVS